MSHSSPKASARRSVRDPTATSPASGGSRGAWTKRPAIPPVPAMPQRTVTARILSGAVDPRRDRTVGSGLEPGDAVPEPAAEPEVVGVAGVEEGLLGVDGHGPRAGVVRIAGQDG